MTSPIPAAAIDAETPTSRAVFRLIAGSFGATNRECDTLRQDLLAKWDRSEGASELVHRLDALDRSDPDGSRGAEARLAVWFSFDDPGTGFIVAADDPMLARTPDELRDRLAAIPRPERH